MANYKVEINLTWDFEEGDEMIDANDDIIRIEKDFKEVTLTKKTQYLLRDLLKSYFTNLLDYGEDSFFYHIDLSGIRDDLIDEEIEKLVKEYSDGIRELILDKQKKGKK